MNSEIVPSLSSPSLCASQPDSIRSLEKFFTHPAGQRAEAWIQSLRKRSPIEFPNRLTKGCETDHNRIKQALCRAPFNLNFNLVVDINVFT